MHTFALSAVLSFITNLLLGVFVIRKSKGNRANTLWGVFCLFVSAWGLGSFFATISKDKQEALFLFKLAYVGVIFIPSLYYLFILNYLQLKSRLTLILSFLYSFFYLFLEWSPFYKLFFGLDNLSLLFNSFYWVYPPTPLFVIFVFLWFFIIILAQFLLFRQYRASSGMQKEQIKYFFVATAVGFVGGGAGFLPCFGVNFYPYLNFAIPLYTAIVAYAIVRHRLMDMKVALRRSSVYLMSLLTIILPSYLLLTVVYYNFGSFYYYGNLFVLIFAVSVFPGLRDFYYRMANKYFFSSLYDSRKVIAELSEKMRSTLDLVRLYAHINGMLSDTFRSKSVNILTYDEKTQEYQLQSKLGLAINKEVLDRAREINESYLTNNIPILVEEIKALDPNNKELAGMFQAYGIEVIVPLNIKNKTIGLFLLGAKESGDIYNSEDLQVLEIISAQAAIAIENAMLYEEMRDFNSRLQEEVGRATAELKDANDVLKQLDQTKSEFISIASHQLRTPLTIIKGYISMMLEKNFGEISGHQKDALEKVFESNERLIRLVENLLNISRIESGRIQYHFEELEFEPIVSGVYSELKNIALKKGLKFDYTPPRLPLPKISADPDKIREVVMNLTDNSIKYTKKGSVKLALKKLKDKIQFTISDTGMGIKDDDLPKLFTKFNRGTGTALIHTEGTGLGLYVARTMIEAHNGKIWAESKGEGMGSRFVFELPVNTAGEHTPE